MLIYRRRFLAGSVAAGAGVVAGLIPLGRSAWALAGDTPSPRRLVVIMLRGAVDGLNVVAPYGDANYAALRPTIGLASPGAEDGVIDLDGRFGLHPALAGLAPLWRDRRLAFVQATGSPDPTRSHFDAQDFLESGTPGIKSTQDGWMNRLISVLPGTRGPTKAVSIGATRPRILSGSQLTTNFPLGANAGKPAVADRPAVAQAFDRLYAGDDAMGVAYRQGQQARQEITQSMQGNMMQGGDAGIRAEQAAADNGAPAPNGFPATAARLADLMVRDERVHLAFADLGGWDTHVNQGGAKGQLASRLQALGDGLAALARGLGPRFDDTVVLVMSEFGRTARENGNRGTDHGHGNVMWAMGGQVNGGKVHGSWPGLAESALHEGRDLAVTTDYRTVIATTLTQHLALGAAQIGTVLPQTPTYQETLPGLFSS